MGGENLGFQWEPIGDRTALLIDAARRIDALEDHLGTDTSDPESRAHGDILRAFTEDRVKFGPSMDVLPIPAASVDGDALTPKRLALEAGYALWWVRVPLDLWARKNWTFTRLEVRIEFNPDDEPLLRPKAYDIFPDRRFDTILGAVAEATLTVGGNAHFALDTGNVHLPPGLPVTAEAGVGALVEVGGKSGFEFGVKVKATAARVDHSSEGLPEVQWRLDGAEFFQQSRPDLVVILQVPKEVETLAVRGGMRAYRRFALFPVGLRTVIQELPQALRAFLTQGAPIEATSTFPAHTLVRS